MSRLPPPPTFAPAGYRSGRSRLASTGPRLRCRGWGPDALAEPRETHATFLAFDINGSGSGKRQRQAGIPELATPMLEARSPAPVETRTRLVVLRSPSPHGLTSIARRRRVARNARAGREHRPRRGRRRLPRTPMASSPVTSRWAARVVRELSVGPEPQVTRSREGAARPAPDRPAAEPPLRRGSNRSSNAFDRQSGRHFRWKRTNGDRVTDVV
jgi:hypothetical protein